MDSPVADSAEVADVDLFLNAVIQKTCESGAARLIGHGVGIKVLERLSHRAGKHVGSGGGGNRGCGVDSNDLTINRRNEGGVRAKGNAKRRGGKRGSVDHLNAGVTNLNVGGEFITGEVGE